MGLDMYLYTNSKRVAKAAEKASGTEEWRLPYGVAIYWRKANQIHNWFVENVQHGNDDCGDYEVEVEQLVELRDVCEKVIAASRLVKGTVMNGYVNGEPNYQEGRVIEDATVAKELLPTAEGFFFGSTEYNEWYLDDVYRTRDGIDAILANIEPYEQHSVAGIVWDSWREKGDSDEWNVKFLYHSSW